MKISNHLNLKYLFVNFQKLKRNKIKRRLRNIMNDASKEISINFNYSYLVIAKPTMLNNEFKMIKETLTKEFNKINK